MQNVLIFFDEISCAFAVINDESIPPLKKVPTSTSAKFVFLLYYQVLNQVNQYFLHI